MRSRSGTTSWRSRARNRPFRSAIAPPCRRCPRWDRWPPWAVPSRFRPALPWPVCPPSRLRRWPDRRRSPRRCRWCAPPPRPRSRLRRPAGRPGRWREDARSGAAAAVAPPDVSTGAPRFAAGVTWLDHPPGGGAGASAGERGRRSRGFRGAADDSHPRAGDGDGGRSGRPDRLRASVRGQQRSRGREITLDRASVVIGRTDENDIVLGHRSISRHHAKIVRDGENYTIVDLQSANGVRVNGEDYERIELHAGDIIELGHVKLRFVGVDENYVFDPNADFRPRRHRAVPGEATLRSGRACSRS